MYLDSCRHKPLLLLLTAARRKQHHSLSLCQIYTCLIKSLFFQLSHTFNPFLPISCYFPEEKTRPLLPCLSRHIKSGKYLIGLMFIQCVQRNHRILHWGADIFLSNQTVFHEAAVKAILNAADGTPHTINKLCNARLLMGDSSKSEICFSIMAILLLQLISRTNGARFNNINIDYPS